MAITTGGVTSFNRGAPGTFMATVTFAEAVTGFVDGELTASHAVVGALKPPGGAGIVFTAIITPNGTGDVVLDVAPGVADDASSNPTAAATPVTITQTPGATVEETRHVIVDFMTNRANNILANQPDVGSFIARSHNSGGGPLGLLRFNGNEADHGFHFATSLSTIRATHAAHTAARLEPIFSLPRWHRRCFARFLWRPCPAHPCAELTLCRYRYCDPDIAAEFTGVRQSS